MTILVTGAGGFIGRELLSVLAETEEQVIAIDQNLASIPDHPGLLCVEADLGDGETLAELFDGSVDRIVHLAAVPGGAAEADPAASQRVNIVATLNLLNLAAAQGNVPRVVYASTIAVLGDHLPDAGVNDETPLRPVMIYGMHKAMIETAMAGLSRRGVIDGISLRLPGIVARPPGPSGLKSAFMSDLFYALEQGQAYTLPVSPGARVWIMSVAQCVRNLVHALGCDSQLAPESRVATLPAIWVSMEELVQELASSTGNSPELVQYAPDSGLEAAFGAQPSLETPTAEALGMQHDGNLRALVANALATIRRSR